MLFEEILPALREGKVGRRTFWPTKKEIEKGGFKDQGSKMIKIRIVNRDGKYVMLAKIYYGDLEIERFRNCFIYGLSTRDLMADDWEIVE